MDDSGTEQQKADKKTGEKPANQRLSGALALAMELGYIIALPIITLALLGRYADRSLETSPLFLLVGIFVALAISTSLIYRKITRLS